MPEERRTIDAEFFLEHLIAGKVDSIDGAQVRGNVFLRGLTIEGAVRALDVTFFGEVDFSECRFERSVDLSGCHFAKTVSFRGARIEGSLELTGAVVHGLPSEYEVAHKEAEACELGGLQVKGDVVLDDVEIRSQRVQGYEDGKLKLVTKPGSLAAQSITVGGRLSMIGIRTDGCVDLRGSTFESDVNILSDCLTEPNRISAIGTDLFIQHCQFHKNLTFEGLQVGGNLHCWGTTLAGMFFIRGAYPSARTPGPQTPIPLPTRIVGNVKLNESSIAYFDAMNLQVDGEFSAMSNSFNTFRLRHEDNVEPNRFGSFLLLGSTFRSDLSLIGMRISGLKNNATLAALTVRNCSVSGDLRFWHPSAAHGNNGRIVEEFGPEFISTIVDGDIEIVGCKIEGELGLTNLAATGAIILDDTEVARDLSFRSVATALHDLKRAGVKLGESIDQHLIGGGARALSLSNVVCRNDVDLTGFRLHPPGSTDTSRLRNEPPDGCVDASGIVVEKKLELFRRLPAGVGCLEDDTCPGCYTIIPGDIDLRGAEIRSLRLSHHSFENRADNGIIDLSGAQIGDFTLPALTAAGEGVRIPGPLDLRDTVVGQWNIFSKSELEAESLRRSDAYLDLLKAETKFRRASFLAIEAALRERGHTADADEIYRQMVHRARQQDTNRFRFMPAPKNDSQAIFGLLIGAPLSGLRDIGVLLLQFLYRVLLGYGTQPMRLLAVIALLWLLALPLFLSPLNYEPSISLLGTDSSRYPTDQLVKAEVTPYPWSTVSGVAFSLQYHIPVVGLVVRDDWALQDDNGRGTCWKNPLARSDGGENCSGATLPGAPEDWGIAILLANWIAWPFVLAFIIGRILRTDRS